jgi:perosamine synthetase
VTDRDDIARAARMMRNQGRDPTAQWLDHEVLGYNYRMSDMNAALGESQVRRMPEFIEKRQRVFDLYSKALVSLGEHLILLQAPKETMVSWFVFVVQLTERYSQADRDRLLMHLREQGIGCSNYFPCIHLQSLYKGAFGYKGGEFPIAETVARHTVALPFFNSLTEKEIDRIVSVLRDWFSRSST